MFDCDTLSAVLLTAVIFTTGFILFPELCSWFALALDGDGDEL